MFDVNIYIETDIKSPASRGGKYGYVLEYITKDQSVYTQAAAGRMQDATDKRLALAALRAAAGRLEKRSRVTVYTSCGYVAAAFENEWLEKWKLSAWRGSHQREIKNRDIWEEVAREMEPHQVTVVVAPRHTYSALLLAELKKAEVTDGEETGIESLSSGKGGNNGKAKRAT